MVMFNGLRVVVWPPLVVQVFYPAATAVIVPHYSTMLTAGFLVAPSSRQQYQPKALPWLRAAPALLAFFFSPSQAQYLMGKVG